MANATLEIPGSAVAHSTPNPALSSGGDTYSDMLPARLRTYGTDEGTQVYEQAEVSINVAAGAPGTTTTDLMAAVGMNGTLLAGLVGKCVYLEIVMKTGSDLRVRLSAANPISVLSGTTDTNPVYGRVILVDRTPNPLVCTPSAPAFDATHKNLTLESTAGATAKVLISVV